MNEATKKTIRDLTEMYIREKTKPGLQDGMYTKLTSVHKAIKPKDQVQKTWSADFVPGKGEGLTILLHGKPGVGKTYTAGQGAKFLGSQESWKNADTLRIQNASQTTRSALSCL